MAEIKKTPVPLFDGLNQLLAGNLSMEAVEIKFHQDIAKAKDFLVSYRGSEATFNAYRREIERFLQWLFLIQNKKIDQVTRTDFEMYIAFCQAPPKEWIALKKMPRFIEVDGLRKPNINWRPFVVTLSKFDIRNGLIPKIEDYQLSEKALAEIFAIVGSFYNFLIAEDYLALNPVAQIRQKSKYIRKYQNKTKIRRLSDLQWGYVIETAELMAEKSPEQHERTLFIMNLLFGLYLRISELAASLRWTPTMGDFQRDHDGYWWFITVGKGNKQRQISVSDAILQALKRYRKFLGLPHLPSPGEKKPLIEKYRGKGPINSTRQIRQIVQDCFDKAIERLKIDGFDDEAEQLMVATVHWLRHTGISEDVKHRPREHVRDDAGHSSSAITDKYIDIELRARHASARKKKIKPEFIE